MNCRRNIVGLTCLVGLVWITQACSSRQAKPQIAKKPVEEPTDRVPQHRQDQDRSSNRDQSAPNQASPPSAPDTKPAPDSKPAPDVKPTPDNKPTPDVTPDNKPAPDVKPTPDVRPTPDAIPTPDPRPTPQAPAPSPSASPGPQSQATPSEPPTLSVALERNDLGALEILAINRGAEDILEYSVRVQVPAETVSGTIMPAVMGPLGGVAALPTARGQIVTFEIDHADGKCTVKALPEDYNSSASADCK